MNVIVILTVIGIIIIVVIITVTTSLSIIFTTVVLNKENDIFLAGSVKALDGRLEQQNQVFCYIRVIMNHSTNNVLHIPWSPFFSTTILIAVRVITITNKQFKTSVTKQSV